MGKHTTDLQKALFLTYLQYIYQAEAARWAGVNPSTAQKIKIRAGEVMNSIVKTCKYTRFCIMGEVTQMQSIVASNRNIVYFQ